MRAHAGLNHQKPVILYARSLAGTRPGDFRLVELDQPIGPSSGRAQRFFTDTEMFRWFEAHVRSQVEQHGGVTETPDFVPLSPTQADLPGASEWHHRLRRAVLTLKWFGGPWAHLYDLLPLDRPANNPDRVSV